MARINIIVPDELRQEIEKVAAEQDRNISWVVRKAIEEYLKKQEEK